MKYKIVKITYGSGDEKYAVYSKSNIDTYLYVMFFFWILMGGLPKYIFNHVFNTEDEARAYIGVKREQDKIDFEKSEKEKYNKTIIKQQTVYEV